MISARPAARPDAQSNGPPEYRRQVAAALERTEPDRTSNGSDDGVLDLLRRQRDGLAVVQRGTAQLPRGPFLACIFFTWGGVEVLKHHINSSRVDLLKEVKELQLQVFELQESAAAFRGRTEPT